MTDLTTLGIAEAGRLMARGDLTSTRLTEAFLARIATVDRNLSSYVTVTADIALNAARQADMEMSGGLRRGPMHGPSQTCSSAGTQPAASQSAFTVASSTPPAKPRHPA